MITAVDTSILVDILAADPSHLKASKFLLTKCLQEGRIIASAVAWAELRPLFESTGQMAKVMGIMMVDFDPLDEMAANLAGEAWKVYRSKGGPKERIISDFLIGAHAQMRADRFLTRDRGFYRQYFNKLNVLEP